MVAAFVCPMVLAYGAGAGPGWWLGLMPALGLLALLVLDLRRGPSLAIAGGSEEETGRLPRDFWVAWAFLVAAIGVEFSIVFWAATLVERQATTTVAEAAAIAAAFLGGMFLGRLALSSGVGRRWRTPAMVSGGLAVAAAGAALAWVSTSPTLSTVALLLAGLGVAVLYPLGVAAAIAAAPGRLAQAGNRLTLASGLAILVAPLALGAVADATGVVAGWTLVLVLAGVAFVPVAVLARTQG
jgi:fucose permease